MLTSKQHQLLSYIDGRIRETGTCPSFAEMRDALGLKSKSGIHRMVNGLLERGFIRTLPNRARAIEVVRRAPGLVPAVLPRPGQDGIPLLGRIAAGTPMTALQERGRFVRVPDLEPEGHFALEVRGDSMDGAGIIDGDLVVVRRQDRAEPGDIVVALVDGEEATLKRLRLRGDMVALEPANPAYETRLLPSARISIQGRLVRLVRRYQG